MKLVHLVGFYYKEICYDAQSHERKISKDVSLFLGGPMNSFNLQGRRFSQRSSTAKSTGLLGPQHEGSNAYQNVDNWLPIYTA
jgi:hypothetical protein